MLNYLLVDKVMDDIIYEGGNKGELIYELESYIANNPHIDKTKITPNDLQLLRYSSLKEIGICVYAFKK